VDISEFGAVGLDLQHGKVGAGIGADERGVEFLAVVQHHGELGTAFNDMVVGDEIAVLGDEETGTLCNRTGTIAAALAALGTTSVPVAPLVAPAAEFLEEALHRMIVRQVLE